MNTQIQEKKGGINPKVLEWARKDADLTESQVAEKLNIYSEDIAKWEKGTSYPNIALLRELSILYDTPFSYFFRSTVPTVITVKDFRGRPKEKKREITH